MRNTGLNEAQAGIKIAGRNTNNFRYAEDSTNLTVAWAPSGGWDPKTEQLGSFAREAELSRRADSHVDLARLRASRSLKDFQEHLRQLGEGRAADAGQQPQQRAGQHPL